MKKANPACIASSMELADRVIEGYSINRKEASFLVLSDTQELIVSACRIREHLKGKEVKLCSIVNAKSGNCSEDCRFCAQSAHNHAKIGLYPLLKKDEIVNAAKKAMNNKASCFGIVTSGDSLTDEEFGNVIDAAKTISDLAINISVSIGRLTRERLVAIKAAGIGVVHHNLETSERYFTKVCSTHSYKDRLNTVRMAIEEGLKVCCGGLLGMGETFDDRIDLAMTLQKLGIMSIPLNFFNPVEGTRFFGMDRLSEEEILKTISLFRFINPKADIRVCGGREVNLVNKQNQIFNAGANGMMVGGYLTTSGRAVEDDLKMIKDCSMTIVKKESNG